MTVRGGLSSLTRVALASTGLRASGILLGGVVANIAGAYAFNFLCIRWLGPGGYGEVAALTAITTILLLPLLGVQAALAREVAAFQARGSHGQNAALLRLTGRRTVLLTAVGTFVFLALAPALKSVLGIDSIWAVAAAAVGTATGVALPILQGFLQGVERFGRITAALTVYAISRPLVTMPLLLAGLGAAGALSAAAIASVVAGFVAMIGLLDLIRSDADAKVRIEFAGFIPVIVGLLAFTVLMNLDVIAAKIFLTEDEAGTYAAASLVGKLAALLPAGAIAPVLLPRATGRIERSEDPVPIVAASLAATLAFGAALTLVLLVIPEGVVDWAFGPQFGDARDLLAPCAATMTLCGLVNVGLAFAFALRDRSLVTLVVLGVVLQVSLLAFFHSTPYQILAATAIASGAVIFVHELLSPTAVWRLRRA